MYSSSWTALWGMAPVNVVGIPFEYTSQSSSQLIIMTYIGVLLRQAPSCMACFFCHPILGDAECQSHCQFLAALLPERPGKASWPVNEIRKLAHSTTWGLNRGVFNHLDKTHHGVPLSVAGNLVRNGVRVAELGHRQDVRCGSQGMSCIICNLLLSDLLAIFFRHRQHITSKTCQASE